MKYKKPNFSLAWLKTQLDYDRNTGVFTWKITRKGTKKGRVAGNKDKDGYIYIRLKRKLWAAHRLAIWWETGVYPEPDEVVDHVNGIRVDNRMENLRVTTRSKNAMNRSRPKARMRATSKYIGVYRSKDGKWRAQIEKEGEVETSPPFIHEIDAAVWRVKKEAEVHGEYAQKDNVRRLLKELI